MSTLSVGSVINRSFAIYAKNFMPFTLLAFIMKLPIILYVYVMLSGSLAEIQQNHLLMTYVIMFGGGILSMVATAAITYGVVEELRGNHQPMSRCISVGLSRLFPILGTAILVGLVVAVGFVLLIIPGIVLMCMFWLAIPSVVIEGNGGAAALTRSKHLTEGYMMKIFGILFIFGVIGWVAQQIITAAITLPTSSAEALSYIWTLLMFNFLADIIISSATAVANAVVYSDIRSIKEGIDSDELATVFD